MKNKSSKAKEGAAIICCGVLLGGMCAAAPYLANAIESAAEPAATMHSVGLSNLVEGGQPELLAIEALNDASGKRIFDGANQEMETNDFKFENVSLAYDDLNGYEYDPAAKAGYWIYVGVSQTPSSPKTIWRTAPFTRARVRLHVSENLPTGLRIDAAQALTGGYFQYGIRKWDESVAETRTEKLEAGDELRISNDGAGYIDLVDGGDVDGFMCSYQTRGRSVWIGAKIGDGCLELGGEDQISVVSLRLADGISFNRIEATAVTEGGAVDADESGCMISLNFSDWAPVYGSDTPIFANFSGRQDDLTIAVKGAARVTKLSLVQEEGK